jgi:hypothetical protein
MLQRTIRSRLSHPTEGPTTSALGQRPVPGSHCGDQFAMAVRTSASIVDCVKSVQSVRSVADESGRSGRSRAAFMAVVVYGALRGLGGYRRGGGGNQLGGMSFPRPGFWRRSDNDDGSGEVDPVAKPSTASHPATPPPTVQLAKLFGHRHLPTCQRPTATGRRTKSHP